jgi:hypothetical protein
MPAAMGLAIDVPEFKAYVPPGMVLKTDVPRDSTSTSKLYEENEDLTLFDATDATDSTSG